MNNKTARILRKLAAKSGFTKKQVYRQYLSLSHKKRHLLKVDVLRGENGNA